MFDKMYLKFIIMIAMFRSVLLDKETWTEHLKLDPITGLDPPDIKIRAAQGKLLIFCDYYSC